MIGAEEEEDKTLLRKELNELTAQFLAAGGEVQRLIFDPNRDPNASIRPTNVCPHCKKVANSGGWAVDGILTTANPDQINSDVKGGFTAPFHIIVGRRQGLWFRLTPSLLLPA